MKRENLNSNQIYYWIQDHRMVTTPSIKDEMIHHHINVSQTFGGDTVQYI